MHAALPVAPYFLLVGYPDFFFLWKGHVTQDSKRSPDFSKIDEPSLRAYSEIALQDSSAGREHQHESVVATWLRELTEERLSPPAWMTASGLLAAIIGGSVAHQSPAPKHAELAGVR